MVVNAPDSACNSQTATEVRTVYDGTVFCIQNIFVTKWAKGFHSNNNLHYRACYGFGIKAITFYPLYICAVCNLVYYCRVCSLSRHAMLFIFTMTQHYPSMRNTSVLNNLIYILCVIFSHCAVRISVALMSTRIAIMIWNGVPAFFAMRFAKIISTEETPQASWNVMLSINKTSIWWYILQRKLSLFQIYTFLQNPIRSNAHVFVTNTFMIHMTITQMAIHS